MKTRTSIMNTGWANFIAHFLFWLISFIVLFDLFTVDTPRGKADYIYTLVFIFTIMIPVYLNIRLLIPHFFSRSKYLLYLLLAFSLIPIFSFFNQLCFNRFIDYLFPGYYFISYYELIDIARFMAVFLALTTLLKLSKSWFLLSEAQKKLDRAEKEKIKSELQALKSQVNPHFLFNSLNNIYALAMSKSESASGAIIKLSNILRYVIYRGSEDKVSIADEVEILQQYIDLQSLRHKKASLDFSFEVQHPELEISPLIFLPLVENGFKHGIKGETSGAYLKIRLESDRNEVFFRTENNSGTAVKTLNTEEKGIGLENVKRRLELSYPGAHEFNTFEFSGRFITELKIKTGG